MMRTVVCIGGGRIGSRAAHEARRTGARVLVIDKDRNCLIGRSVDAVVQVPDSVLDAEEGKVLLLEGDGTSVLLDVMKRWVPDVVVPGARGHLAGHLAVEHCRSMGLELSPASDLMVPMMSALPPLSIVLCDNGQAVITTSHMIGGGSCIEDCEQPDACPVTGAPIPRPMHDMIKKALLETVDQHVVLTASSIVRMGGIQGSDLGAMLSTLASLEEGKTIGIATSCRCHGVINLFRSLKKRNENR